jgi:hypothetical protein
VILLNNSAILQTVTNGRILKRNLGGAQKTFTRVVVIVLSDFGMNLEYCTDK